MPKRYSSSFVNLSVSTFGKRVPSSRAHRVHLPRVQVEQQLRRNVFFVRLDGSREVATCAVSYSPSRLARALFYYRPVRRARRHFARHLVSTRQVDRISIRNIYTESAARSTVLSSRRRYLR